MSDASVDVFVRSVIGNQVTTLQLEDCHLPLRLGEAIRDGAISDLDVSCYNDEDVMTMNAAINGNSKLKKLRLISNWGSALFDTLTTCVCLKMLAINFRDVMAGGRLVHVIPRCMALESFMVEGSCIHDDAIASALVAAISSNPLIVRVYFKRVSFTASGRMAVFEALLRMERIKTILLTSEPGTPDREQTHVSDELIGLIRNHPSLEELTLNYIPFQQADMRRIVNAFADAPRNEKLDMTCGAMVTSDFDAIKEINETSVQRRYAMRQMAEFASARGTSQAQRDVSHGPLLGMISDFVVGGRITGIVHALLIARMFQE